MEEANLPKPARNGACNEAAYLVSKTSSSQVAPKCGDLTGQSFTYDIRYQDEIQLIINSTAQRDAFNWNIKVQQVPCSEYTGEDLTGGVGSGTETSPDVDIGTGSAPETGVVPGIVTAPDGGTGSSTVGPIEPELPTGAEPPAPPPTTSVPSKPAFVRCGQRGPPFNAAGRNREAVSRSLAYRSPYVPAMGWFTGRRKGGYPRPGSWRSDLNQRRVPSLNRPSRRKANENRRNQSSNKKQGDSKGNSAVQQETQPAVKEEATPAITTDEWGVPKQNGSLLHQYLGDRSVFTNRITYGQLAGIHEFPWQVAMTVRGKFHCGACIIGEYWILTAAHCVVSYKNSPRTLDLSLGDWDLSVTNDGPNKKVEVATITVHPQYSRSTLQNDLAILKLTSKIEYTNDIQPICLPDKDVASAGNLALVSGWGRNEHQKLQPQLHYLEATVLSNVLCDERWNAQGAPKGFIVRSMMCMDSTNGDSCNGDSGGPCVVEEPAGSGNYKLGGLVSFGSGSCVDEALPGVYTRVGYFIDWIKSNMV